MATSSKEDVLEPHSRHIGTATVYINTDASWSIGPTPTQLVRVTYDTILNINDDTFGYSAIAAESNFRGGYRLFVRSNESNDTIVEVSIGADGKADPASVTALTQAQMFAIEESLQLDLNESGGYGAGSVLVLGGAVNLYTDGVGAYQLGVGTAAPVTMRVNGAALTDEVLPAGWNIVEAALSGNGFKAYAQDPSGAIFEANFTADGNFTGGDMLSAAQLDALEQSQGLDIDGDSDLPMPAGWTSGLTDPALKKLIESALTPEVRLQSVDGNAQALSDPAGGVITHAELVKMVQTIAANHKAAGTTAITAAEVSTLQALAARGKAAFTGASASAGEYLAYVFSKMVSGSEANRFFTGGKSSAGELGSLTAGTSVANFEKLIDKWLLGGDLPNTATAGDSATGAAKAVTPGYAKSTGAMFVDGVSIADVAQGTAGDCYLIAVFGGLAGTNPTAVQNMVVENVAVDGTRTWGVRFFDVNKNAHWVTVNDMLPVTVADPNRLAYAGTASKDLNGEIWTTVIEKAYVQANTLGILPRAENNGKNIYQAVEGGNGEALSQLLGGGKVTQYSVTQNPEEARVTSVTGNEYLIANIVNGKDPAAMAAAEKVLKDWINSGKTIWLGVTTTQKDSFGNWNLVGSHAHFLVDADPANPDNNTVLSYNPWGLKALPNPPAFVGADGGSPGLSPVPYTLTELMGIPGLDFGIFTG